MIGRTTQNTINFIDLWKYFPVNLGSMLKLLSIIIILLSTLLTQSYKSFLLERLNKVCS